MTGGNEARALAKMRVSLPDSFRQSNVRSTVYVLEKIAPIGIITLNLSNFPNARPSLQCFLPLDCNLNIIIAFNINEPTNVVFGAESSTLTASMFRHPPRQIIGDTYVERPVFTAGKNVDVKRHCFIRAGLDSRKKPEDDRRE